MRELEESMAAESQQSKGGGAEENKRIQGKGNRRKENG